jgi:hypothetical protein
MTLELPLLLSCADSAFIDSWPVTRCPLDWLPAGHAEEALDTLALNATGSSGRRHEHAATAAKLQGTSSRGSVARGHDHLWLGQRPATTSSSAWEKVLAHGHGTTRIASGGSSPMVPSGGASIASEIDDQCFTDSIGRTTFLFFIDPK